MFNLFKKVATPIILAYVLLLIPYFFSLSPVAKADDTETKEEIFYYLSDHLGGIDVVTDENGNIVEHKDYLPYGAERLGEQLGGQLGGQLDATPDPQYDPPLDPQPENYGYTGKELDDETGLYYYGARYYDPQIGRFTQIDPLVLGESGKPLADVLSNPQALNGYSYVLNNPMRYVDEEGMYKSDVHYTLTNYLALKAGLDSTIANEIAFFDDRMDTDPATKPDSYENATNGTTEKYHFQQRSVAEAWVNAGIAKKDSREFGKALHTYQDTYSHSGLNKYSHVALTGEEYIDPQQKTDPDKTNNNVFKASFMSFNTFSFIREFQRYKLGIADEKAVIEYNKQTLQIYDSIKADINTYLSSEDKTTTKIYSEIHGDKKKDNN